MITVTVRFGGLEHHRACPTCGGTGSIAVDLGMFGMGQARMVCPECGGSGKVVADPCPVCGGEVARVRARPWSSSQQERTTAIWSV
ncbi:MAG: zinc finger domain-containing protein [Collinsella intestinalis]